MKPPPTKIRVYVRKDEWYRGYRGDPQYCPIALATKRILETKGYHISKVCVGIHIIKVFTYMNRQYVFSLPPKAQEFIRDYDSVTRNKSYFDKNLEFVARRNLDG